MVGRRSFAAALAHLTPGECYWMPAGLPMSGYNSGDTDAVFIDSFTLPEGTSYFDAVEQVQPIPGHDGHSSP